MTVEYVFENEAGDFIRTGGMSCYFVFADSLEKMIKQQEKQMAGK